MALSDQDRDWIKAIARDLTREVVREVIKEHIRSCPHGQTLLATRAFLAGMMIASGLLGGGAGAIITKIFLTGP